MGSRYHTTNNVFMWRNYIKAAVSTPFIPESWRSDVYACACHVWFKYLWTGLYVVWAQVHLNMWVHEASIHIHVEASGKCWKSSFDCIPRKRLTLNWKHIGSGSVYCLCWMANELHWSTRLWPCPSTPALDLQICLTMPGYSWVWGSDSWFSRQPSLLPLHFLLNPERPQKRQYWLPLYYYIASLYVCSFHSLIY